MLAFVPRDKIQARDRALAVCFTNSNCSALHRNGDWNTGSTKGHRYSTPRGRRFASVPVDVKWEAAISYSFKTNDKEYICKCCLASFGTKVCTGFIASDQIIVRRADEGG